MAAFSIFRAEAVIQSLTDAVVGIAAHPQDDLILATALSAGANFLVTGDTQLLERGVFRDTQIVSPRQFLDGLEDAIVGG